MAGRAEPQVPPMLKCLNPDFWLHKSVDGRFTEGGPDYHLSLTGTQIEVKNSERTGELIDEPSEKQIKLLDLFGGFIFLVMYDGDPDNQRLPRDADAYLIPWSIYKDWWDRMKQIKGKSVRRHATTRGIGVDEEMLSHQLVWEKGKWTIPANHVFWATLRLKARQLATWVDGLPLTT